MTTKNDGMTSRVACRAETPLGVFTALYENGAIRRVLFPDEICPSNFTVYNDSLPFAAQISEYFSGTRREFSLPMLIPGTPFREAVYKAVITIPYGGTASYSAVALAAGFPLAMRAVGTAMKQNPLPLLIPCHRVVHKGSKAQAYRGGLDIKSYLLDLESNR